LPRRASSGISPSFLCFQPPASTWLLVPALPEQEAGQIQPAVIRFLDHLPIGECLLASLGQRQRSTASQPVRLIVVGFVPGFLKVNERLS
jgi:hypothetical protein